MKKYTFKLLLCQIIFEIKLFDISENMFDTIVNIPDLTKEIFYRISTTIFVEFHNTAQDISSK